MQEVAGHKLSDAVIQRLPTLATLTPGGRISYSEVIAFHNVVRGKFVLHLIEMGTELCFRYGHG